MLLSSRNTARPLVAALVVALIVFAAGCGGDDSGDRAATTSSARATGPGNGTDLAFVTDMIPHHEGALAMAQIAAERAESDFVRELAATIDLTQTQEIAVLRELEAALRREGVEPESLSHAMDMGMGTGDLKTAEPFDRTFVDMMIPHHRDAILMAREVLKKGENAEVRQLAMTIIEEQSVEIKEMNSFREDTYGAASPAGGVPAPSSSDSKTEPQGGGHGGM